jgi:hypothetical protein
MRRSLFLTALILLGCTSTITVLGAGATVLPPDPVLTCLTPTLTLKPGQQGVLKWEASVPVGSTAASTASILATYSDASTVNTPSTATSVTVSEPTATAVAFTFPLPTNVTFVSGTVTKADASTSAIAAPTGTNVTAALGPIAAGQKATINLTVQARTG